MKRFLLVLAAGLLLIVPAPAQNQSTQTPSQLAIQITSIIGQWAQQLEVAQKQMADLQAQLATVTRERDEARAKLPPAEASKK